MNNDDLFFLVKSYYLFEEFFGTSCGDRLHDHLSAHAALAQVNHLVQMSQHIVILLMIKKKVEDKKIENSKKKKENFTYSKSKASVDDEIDDWLVALVVS